MDSYCSASTPGPHRTDVDSAVLPLDREGPGIVVLNRRTVLIMGPEPLDNLPELLTGVWVVGCYLGIHAPSGLDFIVEDGQYQG